MRKAPGILLVAFLLLVAAVLGGCAHDVAADKVLVRGGASATASTSASSPASGVTTSDTAAAGGVTASGRASVDAPAVEKELSAIERSLNEVSMPSDADLKDIDAATR